MVSELVYSMQRVGLEADQFQIDLPDDCEYSIISFSQLTLMMWAKAQTPPVESIDQVLKLVCPEHELVLTLSSEKFEKVYLIKRKKDV